MRPFKKVVDPHSYFSAKKNKEKVLEKHTRLQTVKSALAANFIESSDLLATFFL